MVPARKIARKIVANHERGRYDLEDKVDSPDDIERERLESETIMSNIAGNPEGRQKELKLRRYFNGSADQVFDKIAESVQSLKSDNNVASIFDELPGPVAVPEDVELKVVYKDGKDGQKLEYQIRWPVKPSSRKAL